MRYSYIIISLGVRCQWVRACSKKYRHFYSKNHTNLSSNVQSAYSPHFNGSAHSITSTSRPNRGCSAAYFTKKKVFLFRVVSYSASVHCQCSGSVHVHPPNNRMSAEIGVIVAVLKLIRYFKGLLQHEKYANMQLLYA